MANIENEGEYHTQVMSPSAHEEALEAAASAPLPATPAEPVEAFLDGYGEGAGEEGLFMNESFDDVVETLFGGAEAPGDEARTPSRVPAEPASVPSAGRPPTTSAEPDDAKRMLDMLLVLLKGRGGFRRRQAEPQAGEDAGLRRPHVA